MRAVSRSDNALREYDKAGFLAGPNCDQWCLMRYKIALLLTAVFLGISITLWPSRQEKTTKYFPEAGFTVWRPPGWHIDQYERAGTVSLWPEAADVSTKEAVRVVFWAGVCSKSPGEGVLFESEIKSLENVYELETSAIMSGIQSVEIGDQVFNWIEVELPTRALLTKPEPYQPNPPRILAKNSLRRVAIYELEDSDGQWMQGYIYFGRSDELNEQALEIMYSVHLVCW